MRTDKEIRNLLKSYEDKLATVLQNPHDVYNRGRHQTAIYILKWVLYGNSHCCGHSKAEFDADGHI